MAFLDPQTLILLIPVVLLALTLHEFAHAWTALYFGDPTAKMAGRVTLNPLKHLDPIGTLFLLLAHVGWAKPVPVDPRNFSHPRADLWVSLAGIIANVLQAIAFACIWHGLLYLTPEVFNPTLARFLVLGIVINLSLALFNLLPLFPLDGSHVLSNLLPRSQRYAFVVFSQRYGTMILLGLFMADYVIAVSPLDILIGLPRRWLTGFLLGS